MMKRLFTLLLCTLPGFIVLYAQNPEVLTNQAIVEMVEMGFEPDVIISKIQTTKTDFDLSLDALKDLKAKNVPGIVIATMIKTDQAAKTEEADSEKTGIFVLKSDGSEQRIFPTVFSGSKTRTLASGLTYGIASGKIKSVLNNASSRNTIASNQPEFLFYFRPFKENQIGLVNDWWFRATTSPNEFILVTLDVNTRKGTRELETGKANVWVGTDVGTKKGKAIAFKVEELSNGTFKVIPEKPLEKGEYCFFYQGTIPQGGYTNQSVFDFSIQ